MNGFSPQGESAPMTSSGYVSICGGIIAKAQLWSPLLEDQIQQSEATSASERGSTYLWSQTWPKLLAP